MRIQYIVDVIESSHQMFGKRRKVQGSSTKKGLKSGSESQPIGGATGGGENQTIDGDEADDFQPETYVSDR